MAEKINIEVALKSELQKAGKDISTLQKEKVFNSPGGEKTLTKLNGLLQRLNAVDLSKLSGPSLTKFLNDLSKLRDLLDSSSRTLTGYTEEFKKQQEVVSNAVKKLNQQKGVKSEALSQKKESLQKVNLTGHTYFNKDTGKQVSNIETIIELFKKGLLEIRGEKGKRPVSEASYGKIVESTGIKQYSESSDAYEKAKEEVSAQQVIVNAEKTKLEGLQQTGGVHPVTKEIQTTSAETENLISNIREQEEKKDEDDINKTTKAINNQIPVINKQSSALGHAFKQFTIYNVALRAAKTALREAVQTVKELDKYLTEQAMVTGMSREQTYKLIGSYQELAMQCGATTKEIAQVSTEYMKQGKTIQESLVLTEAAVKAAKVARVSVGDSVNYLTTALNGFRLEAGDAMAVSDKFAAIAAASATDYDELAIALSKVASQANLAGMSIDYTTALLTKGLETTREAPETMGTALKTIIARMRELGDYGETLDDGMDLNNVESQLAYVDIALRDANGELRSTEDVLDELGRKWDTLNKNQQAAIAKALAGTRQQSRLIAMMEDYDRVIELQEIAQNSAGATAAQAGVYLEGMEAAMNNIQVAWEKIVMTVVDSEAVINAFHNIAAGLDWVAELLSSAEGIKTFLTVALSLATMFVIQKISEYETQKAINRETLREHKMKKTELRQEKQKAILDKQELVNQKKINLEKLKEKRTSLEIALTNEKNPGRIKKLEGQLKKTNQQIIADESAIKIEEQEIKQLKAESNLLMTEELQLSSQIAQNGAGLLSVFGSITTVLSPILSIMSMIFMVQNAIIAAKKIEKKTTKEVNNEEKKGLGTKIKAMFAKVVGAFASGGIPGIIAGIAIATGLAVGLGFAIAAAVGAFTTNKEEEDPADKINKLAAEVYKLTEKANAINKVADSFDALDGKLIKTNADLKEMNSLLDQAADQLSDEEVADDKDIGYGLGVSEKEYYQSMTTQDQKRAALDLIEQVNRNKIAEKREEIRAELRSNTHLLTDTSAKALQVQSSVYADNNDQLHQYIDLLEDAKELNTSEASAVQAFTKSILENMSATEAWAYAEDGTGQKVQKLVQTIRDLTVETKNLKGEFEDTKIGVILTTDDYTLTEQVNAFKKARQAIRNEYGEASQEYSSFIDSFKQYEFFASEDPKKLLSTQALEFIDASNLDISKLNDLYDAWEKLKNKGIKDKEGNLITKDVWQTNFDDYLNALAKYEGDALKATEEVFGEYLDGTVEAQNAFLTAYGDIIETGALNMAQNMDKIKNSINNFYEKALEWDTLSESDKAEFRQDNFELFEGEAGKKLFDAFESGNYERIEEALRNNETLQKRIKDQREQIRQELLIQEKLEGEERDEVRIAELKKYAKYLDDVENLFKASLEIRLEQQQKELDEYKSLLEKERDALTESLEKRKEAYEKYFDDISQKEEDEEYETESERLITNISKLASSGDADAKAKTMELEQQLKELEAERLQTLKERAREAILEKMDSEVEEINDKFDKLLENEQALLMAMQGELENPTEFLTKMIGNKFMDGATELQLEDFVNSLESTYGSSLDGVDWDAIREEVIEQLFLNVNGQDVYLNESDQQSVFKAVKKALQEIGKR